MILRNIATYTLTIRGLVRRSYSFTRPMTLSALLSSIFLMCALVSCSGKGGLEQAQKIVPDNAAEEDRFGSSLEISGNRAVIGAPGTDSPYEKSGAAYIYEYIADSGWTSVEMLSPSNPDVGFGADVAISGERVLIGAPLVFSLSSNLTPSARIYERQSDGSWAETAEILTPEETNSTNFATEVALAGDVAFIAAPMQWVPEVDANPGVVYVFERQANDDWQLVTRLMASDPDHDDRFGSDLALSGDRAIIGARNDDEMGEDAGAAYIFERQQDGSWTEVTKLAPAGSDAQFGRTVSLEGDRALIGSPWHLYEGTAHIFERDQEGNWEEMQVLEAVFEERSSLFEGNIRFGEAVHLDGNRALVGAPFAEDANEARSGLAYLFEFQEDSTWAGTQISASDESVIGWFGGTLSLSEQHILIGAVDAEIQSGVPTGAVYHFRQ